ncbi:hypothetical protein Bbelb_118020 [Branchiostoma belcheri]|nr:hypothetical protein Bbelb_118020 [Branchiostoma belcheri]
MSGLEPGASGSESTTLPLRHTTPQIVEVKNITCILLTGGEHKKLFLTIPFLKSQTETTETSYTPGTKESESPTHYPYATEKDGTCSKPVDQSTFQMGTTPVPDLEMVQTPDHVLIPVVSAVVGKMASVVEAVSCRSLPTVLYSMEHTYGEIQDKEARAHHIRGLCPASHTCLSQHTWEGTRNTARRASLPTVTLPNTYWPWEIPGEGTRNTARRASLPTVTLPNTYWPWEIPGEGTRIPGERTRNTAQPASLPTVTLPNTYWPWEIPGEGTRNTPWEIPGEGTRNTAQPASLPIATLTPGHGRSQGREPVT